MLTRLRNFIICLLVILAPVSQAQTDTLLHLVQEVNKKGDSVGFVSVFRKFNWQVTVRNTKGGVLHYVSRHPDTVFSTQDIDSVHMSSSFLVAPDLRDVIIAIQYKIKGSVEVRLNQQVVLATGVFYHARNSKQSRLVTDDYKDVVFHDSVQHIEVTYLPYPGTKIFDLGLRLYPLSVAESQRQVKADNAKETFGFSFYYLSFGIVFMMLFVFFRERTENLYFSLFCLFAALSGLWSSFNTGLLDELESFLTIFCFEFLSIFFYKILRNKEKSKIPLLVIAGLMAICFLPFVRHNYFSFAGHSIPWILVIVYCVLFLYVWSSVLYSLIRGIGQKQWEAKAVLVVCFIPVALFVVAILVFLIGAAVTGANENYSKFFLKLFSDFYTAIIYIYPLGAVYILGRRNGLNQKQLIAQVASIQQLSEENLTKEKEKKHLLENQKEALEKEVLLRTAEIVLQKEEIELQHEELKVEKKKSDDLLRNILPEEVANELKNKGFSEARLFDNVTVLFADFVDFTKAGEALTPQELVNELHACFKGFDEIISKYNIEKIKTIGDAYLAVSGLPAADQQHAINVVKASLEIDAFMKRRQAELGSKTFSMRVGIHSGSVVAGIVGVKKFAYDIWGDTVNTAARIEQSSEPGRINISGATYELLHGQFSCEYRGEIEAKNKGLLKMYYVNAVK